MSAEVLLDRPVREKPDYFGPDGVPPGFEDSQDAYAVLDDGFKWKASRPRIRPTVAVGHTNGANHESTTASQIRWGQRVDTGDGRNNTKPHYLLGDVPRKVLPTNLRAIANSTLSWVEQEYGVRDSSYWTIAVETADVGKLEALRRGINWPVDCGPFLYDNADDFAHLLAYEAVVWEFPLWVPSRFGDPGVVSHTIPFPYPYFTIRPGKTCPGTTKHNQLLNLVLPRARQVFDAWTKPTTPPTPPPTPEPPEEVLPMEEMRIRPYGYANQFVLKDGEVFPVSQTLVKYAKSLPLVVDRDPVVLKALLHKTGLALSDLTVHKEPS